MSEVVRDAWHMPRVVVFLAVVEHGSISAAARALSLSKGVVSTHLKQLEEVCSARLFERSTRRVTLTQAGATFLPFARRMVGAWGEGLEALEAQMSEPTGRLVLTASSLLQSVLTQVVGEYRRRYPKVKVDVRVTDDVLDLIGEGIDVALRTGGLADSELVARKLGSMQEIIVASPSFLEGRPEPQRLEQLLSWPWVRHTALPVRRRLHGPDGVAVDIEPDIQVTIDEANLLRQMALAGVGLVVIPYVAVHQDLESGVLTWLLPQWRARLVGLYAVFPSKKHLAPRVSRFLEILEVHVSKRLLKGQL